MIKPYSISKPFFLDMIECYLHLCVFNFGSHSVLGAEIALLITPFGPVSAVPLGGWGIILVAGPSLVGMSEDS